MDRLQVRSDGRVVDGGDANRVRQASLVEASDVFRLVEEYYDAVSVVVRDDRDTLLDYLVRRDCGVWLAYDGDLAVGCILYHPLPELGRTGEVKRLYIQPSFRRRGLAQQLLDVLERSAVRRGDQWLYLDTNDTLRAAIAFYERNGYLRCGPYNDNPQATIFMRKRLTSSTA
jgi:ribosomal protein S18 acetylase RimI-like enzyme